jgi:hypothetical protein
VDEGLLPDRFPESGAPLSGAAYTTADATWRYVSAIDAVDRRLRGSVVAVLLPCLDRAADRALSKL